MIVYLDTSASYKLLHRESKSEELIQWLSSLDDLQLVASELMRVELLGNLGARHPQLVPAANELVKRVTLISLSPQYLNGAIELVAQGLGTLDAIHLATAMSAGSELHALVTYDKQLAQAAAAKGVKVVTP